MRSGRRRGGSFAAPWPREGSIVVQDCDGPFELALKMLLKAIDKLRKSQ